MLLGEVCSRGCRFCAVTAGKPGGKVDREEPARVAAAVARLGLRYVVLTMVTRDDLPDGGAAVVAETVRRLHDAQPGLLVETLVSDFGGDEVALAAVVDAEPDVFGHNVEVVREWTHRVRDRRCSYDRSLQVLARAHRQSGGRPTKSSLMVGVGETDEQVLETLRDLRAVGVELLTIGQYLRPTDKHHPVARFVEPATFDRYAEQARQLGFRYVASGPLVRSSYRAAELFLQGELAEGGASQPQPLVSPEAMAPVDGRR
jgi:lipoic acid synthetase